MVLFMLLWRQRSAMLSLPEVLLPQWSRHEKQVLYHHADRVERFLSFVPEMRLHPARA
jgi:hypothetical protein